MGRIKVSTEPTVKRPPPPQLTPFKPGQSGNPGGRPFGARSKITESFLKELQTYFDREGPALLERAGQESPAALVAVYAKLLPRDIELKVSGSAILDLTEDQRTRIAESWLLSTESLNEPIEVKAVRIDEPKQKVLDHDEPARVKRTKPAHRVSRNTSGVSERDNED